MKKTNLFMLMLVICLSVKASGQIPQTISYQGVLTDASGHPVPDQFYVLTFKIYDAQTGGTTLWQELQETQTDDGIFNVILGSINPLTIEFDKPYWLGITIGGTAELSPRIELTSSAYSLNARTVADDAITGEKIASGQVVRSINTLKDDITLSAGDNVTITQNENILTISATATPGAGNTLDQAYDQGGAGAGRTIVADAGPVKIDGNDGLLVNGNVGIGLENPETKLHVSGQFKVCGTGSIADRYLLFKSTGAQIIEVTNDLEIRYGRTYAPAHVNFSMGLPGGMSTSVMRLSNEGNVGIGTTVPAYKLDVIGTAQITGFKMPTDAAENYVLTSDASGVGTWKPASSDGGINGSGTVNFIPKFSNATTLDNSIIYENNGVIGIGTSNPQAKLHVTHDKEYAGRFTSNYSSDETHVIHAEYTGGPSSVFHPVAIYGKSKAGDEHGYGAYFEGGKIGVKAEVLPSGAGFYHGVFGNVEGGNGANFAITGHAGGSGKNHGVFAHGYGMPGSTGSNYGVYANADGDGTCYGIYAGAGGSGVNYAGYFNGDVQITGNVGIGSTQPTQKLDVAGTAQMTGFKMRTGAQNNYVLTSDANGVGTWQQATAGADNDWTISGNNMYAAPSGNIGIGLTNPDTKLHIGGSLKLWGPGYATNRYLYFYSGGVQQLEATNDFNIHYATIYNPGALVFREGSASGMVERMRIAHRGNVSIGAGDSPAAQLHVVTSQNMAGLFTSNNLSTSTHIIHSEFTGSGNQHVIGIYSKSKSANGYGIGGEFYGGYRGVYGNVEVGSGTGHAVYGRARGSSSGTCYGVYGHATDATTNYGVCGYATEGTTNYAVYASGDLAYTGNLLHVSDAKFKENIQPVANVIFKIKQVESREFEYKKSQNYHHINLAPGKHYGFIAQELERIFPELVHEAVHPSAEELNDEEAGIATAYKSINYIELIPILLQAIKEQQTMIENQQQTINELKIKILKLAE